MKTENNSSDKGITCKNIVVIDTSATIDGKYLEPLLNKQNYNLCGLYNNVHQINFICKCADALIVIDTSGSSQYLQNILSTNDTNCEYTLISNVNCASGNFNYLPLDMLKLYNRQHGNPALVLAHIILDALKLLSMPHNYYLNLSYNKYKKQCQNLLCSVGFSTNHKGTRQLICASYFCVFNNKVNLYASVYPYVANYFDCSVDAVERNIRSSIVGAAQNCKATEHLQNLFYKQYKVQTDSLQLLVDSVLARHNKQVINNIVSTMWHYIY